MSILNSYQVLQATEVTVVTGLVIVQGQSVMVRVVACHWLARDPRISDFEECAAQVAWNFGMSGESCREHLARCVHFPASFFHIVALSQVMPLSSQNVPPRWCRWYRRG